MDDQMNTAIYQLRDTGIRLCGGLVAIYDTVESGSVCGDRFVPERASRAARDHDAILAAAPRNRPIRSASFDGPNRASKHRGAYVLAAKCW